MNLMEKVAVVMGGGRDIGRAVCIKLAKEVADLVSYLASDESSIHTGNDVDINGGLAFS